MLVLCADMTKPDVDTSIMLLLPLVQWVSLIDWIQVHFAKETLICSNLSNGFVRAAMHCIPGSWSRSW